MKAILAVFAALAAGATDDARAPEGAATPVVVELFTSQSCSSCVAAADYFEELAAREDVVALGWHVDYWNALQTSRGRWVDPYSDAAHTDRQRKYNQNLRANNAVYTPQMVVNGAGEATGSARGKIETLIAGERDNASPSRITSMRRDAVGDLTFSVSGSGEVSVVYFTPVSVTAVSGGENAGRQFDDHNIVTRAVSLGSAQKRQFTADLPGEGERCAVLVQAPDQGRILAAQYCAER